MIWKIEHLTEDRVEAAGAVLARSFVADPLAVHMLPDEADAGGLHCYAETLGRRQSPESSLGDSNA